MAVGVKSRFESPHPLAFKDAYNVRNDSENYRTWWKIAVKSHIQLQSICTD